MRAEPSPAPQCSETLCDRTAGRDPAFAPVNATWGLENRPVAIRVKGLACTIIDDTVARVPVSSAQNETETSTFNAVLFGSDGSRVGVHEVFHMSTSASGGSITFDKPHLTCG